MVFQESKTPGTPIQESKTPGVSLQELFLQKCGRKSFLVLSNLDSNLIKLPADAISVDIVGPNGIVPSKKKQLLTKVYLNSGNTFEGEFIEARDQVLVLDTENGRMIVNEWTCIKAQPVIEWELEFYKDVTIHCYFEDLYWEPEYGAISEAKLQETGSSEHLEIKKINLCARIVNNTSLTHVDKVVFIDEEDSFFLNREIKLERLQIIELWKVSEVYISELSHTYNIGDKRVWRGYDIELSSEFRPIGKVNIYDQNNLLIWEGTLNYPQIDLGFDEDIEVEIRRSFFKKKYVFISKRLPISVDIIGMKGCGFPVVIKRGENPFFF